MRSFFLAPEQWPENDQEAVLDGAEARHLLKVLRAAPGDTIRLFDGAGREGRFEITGCDKVRARLRPLDVRTVPQPERRTVLALGWSKAVRRGWLLEKAVELEATGIWFYQADRTQGRVPAEVKENWSGQLVAGAKQSANPWLPVLRTLPEGVHGLAAAATDFDLACLLWEDQAQPQLLDHTRLRDTRSVLFVLGPEGGFSPREIDTLAQSAFLPVSLGDRILRWETAALLCLGLRWWSGQKPMHKE